MKKILWLNILLLLTSCDTSVSHAEQHAIVVGINHYEHSKKLHAPENLEGAINDARRISMALREIGVKLDDQHILLNENARVADFRKAWEALIAQSKKGDQLIFTFAGHGSQEPDFPPKDEPKDQQDETLLFHDFDPDNPKEGRLSDDELLGLFKQAHDKGISHILFVADACHSGGLNRSITKRSITRNAGGWIQPLTLSEKEKDIPRVSDNSLPYVTLLAATEDESLEIPEIDFNAQKHGALSWYFAEALVTGNADRDGDKTINREELHDYIREKVRQKTANLQTPNLQPRGGQNAFESVISLAGTLFQADRETLSSESNSTTNLLKIQAAQNAIPKAVKHYQIVDKGWRIRFAKQGEKTAVYNPVGDGDLLTQINSDKAEEWQALIDKFRLLQLLETHYNYSLRPLNITLNKGDKQHPIGTHLSFSIEPQGNEKLDWLIIFNLAGNGELQFLYPVILKDKDTGLPVQDLFQINAYPYQVPTFKVSPPVGGDHLVVLACAKDNMALRQQFNRNLQQIDMNMLSKELKANHCQVGEYAFFSAASLK